MEDDLFGCMNEGLGGCQFIWWGGGCCLCRSGRCLLTHPFLVPFLSNNNNGDRHLPLLLPRLRRRPGRRQH